jgi:TraB/PrgY/gumN family
MRRISLLGLLLLMPVLASAANQNGEELPTDESGMQVVTVTGVYSGPALWKVTSNDNVMWILGEISPFPRKWKWKSKEFESALRRSQELLIDFSGYWHVEGQQAKDLENAGKLPEGTTLKDVIAPELHARVLATAGKFGNPPLEKWRPFSATNQLVRSSMKTLDLTGFSARFTAAQLGEWRKSNITYFAAPEIPFEARLKNWQHESNEVCLSRLVDTIGDGGVGLKQMGNAWAVGDIKTLRELVPVYSFSRDGFRSGECAAAMHGGEDKARDYKARRTEAWLAQAERALKKNQSTLAVVLMSELFAPDGYLAALRAKGYRIVEPD